MFYTEEECINYIENIKRKDKRHDLNRIKECLFRLGNPEKSFKSIHIAGTNGKGATCYMISKLLLKKGYNVGRFTSPYIVKFNERIVVNDKYIDSDSLIKITNKVKDVTDKYNNEFDDVVPFFEVVTLIGFLYFKEMNCDYCVIECGLGGLLDATNCIDSKIQVITSIGYDHMKTLGETLPEIAYQKLGIVKRGSTLISSVGNDLIKDFERKCLVTGSKLVNITYSDILIKSSINGSYFQFEGGEYFIPLVGKFEVLNACLAIKATREVVSISDIEINEVFKTLKWPGRFEVIKKRPNIILDGAHNISAAEALVSSYKNIISDKAYIIYTGLLDKETSKVLTKLEEIANKIYITSIPDLRAKDPNLIKSEVDFKNLEVIDDYIECLDKVISNLNESDTLLITGSLHFISLVRKYFNLS